MRNQYLGSVETNRCLLGLGRKAVLEVSIIPERGENISVPKVLASGLLKIEPWGEVAEDPYSRDINKRMGFG